MSIGFFSLIAKPIKVLGNQASPLLYPSQQQVLFVCLFIWTPLKEWRKMVSRFSGIFNDILRLASAQTSVAKKIIPNS